MTDDILNEQTGTDPEPTPTPTPPTISDKVKLALRISHDLLDGEITDVITSARLELERAGVLHDYAQGDTEDIETAIKTYALAYFTADSKDAKRYDESFLYQCDCLRKSHGVEDV